MKKLTINVEVMLKINRWYVTPVGLRNLKDKGNILLGMPVLYVLVERPLEKGVQKAESDEVWEKHLGDLLMSL